MWEICLKTVILIRMVLFLAEITDILHIFGRNRSPSSCFLGCDFISIIMCGWLAHQFRSFCLFFGCVSSKWASSENHRRDKMFGYSKFILQFMWIKNERRFHSHEKYNYFIEASEVGGEQWYLELRSRWRRIKNNYIFHVNESVFRFWST